MDKDSFLHSLKEDEPPIHISLYAQALWYDAKGNWQRAHEIIQAIGDSKAARIHAYLHRKEGDLANADYWYWKAGEDSESPKISLKEEWNQLVDEFV
ncbi:MAG TPA: hypothetical protein PLM81_05425 [Ginsengibacter sp.]|nr:hypothetical protein [Ginsengibacter sp.]HRP17358.1 hypothetical protein [Ginsengibacter sp.]HRP44610.1 hypothetical protein [Ginsengibacter sp.]